MHGADAYRGANGPLAVCAGNEMRLTPWYKAFIDAGAEAGYPVTSDHNGYQQEGFGPLRMTIKDGVRSSTANAYLKPVRHRSNLTVVTKALTERVLLDGNRATGIEFSSSGATRQAQATREVIICAGAIGSPTILQRSGIGRETLLKAVDVELVHFLPGVGENLQDHRGAFIDYRCRQPVTHNNKLSRLSDMSPMAVPPFGSVLHALELPPIGGDTLWCSM